MIHFPNFAELTQTKTARDSVNPAVPRDQWPAWAKALALVRKPDDSGLGDVIARIVGPIGGDAYKAWHMRTFGESCGCADRQAGLNAKYPLGD